MLASDKPWKPDAVILLGGVALFCMSTGNLLVLALGKILPGLKGADLQFVQFLVGTLCLHGVALGLTHILLRWHGVTWSEFLGLNRRDLGLIVLRAAAVCVLATPLVLILAEWSAPVLRWLGREPETQSAVRIMETAVLPMRRALFTFASIVLVPVAEEVLFRGLLYATIKEQGRPVLALVVSSVLFSAIHLNWLAFVPFIVLAVILALLYERTGSLLAPIIVHAGFNAINVVAYTLTRGAGG